MLGIALVVSARTIRKGSVAGRFAALALAAILTSILRLYFGIQSWGRGFVPAGLMALLSLLTAALFVGLPPVRIRRRRADGNVAPIR